MAVFVLPCKLIFIIIDSCALLGHVTSISLVLELQSDNIASCVLFPETSCSRIDISNY